MGKKKKQKYLKLLFLDKITPEHSIEAFLKVDPKKVKKRLKER